MLVVAISLRLVRMVKQYFIGANNNANKMCIYH